MKFDPAALRCCRARGGGLTLKVTPSLSVGVSTHGGGGNIRAEKIRGEGGDILGSDICGFWVTTVCVWWGVRLIRGAISMGVTIIGGCVKIHGVTLMGNNIHDASNTHGR